MSTAVHARGSEGPFSTRAHTNSRPADAPMILPKRVPNRVDLENAVSEQQHRSGIIALELLGAFDLRDSVNFARFSAVRV